MSYVRNDAEKREMRRVGLRLHLNPRGICTQLETHHGFTPKATLERVYKLFAKEFGNTVDDFTPLKAVQHAKYPILFIHGKEDRFIPVGMAHELYDACSSDKRLFLVDGAGHGASYANAPKEYESAVMDFVNTHR